MPCHPKEGWNTHHDPGVDGDGLVGLAPLGLGGGLHRPVAGVRGRQVDDRQQRQDGGQQGERRRPHCGCGMREFASPGAWGVGGGWRVCVLDGRQASVPIEPRMCRARRRASFNRAPALPAVGGCSSPKQPGQPSRHVSPPHLTPPTPSFVGQSKVVLLASVRHAGSHRPSPPRLASPRLVLPSP